MTSASTVIDTDIFGRPYATFRGAQDDDGGDAGAGGTDAGNAADDHDDDSTDDQPDANGLTAGGRKLIEAEREATKTAKRALSPWRKLERDFQMGPDEIRARLEGKVQGEDGKTTDVDSIRRDAEKAAMQKVNRRLVLAEVRALATGKFADPTDAHLFLDLDEIDVDDDGNVDTKAIETALGDLLKTKPHLAKKTDADDATDFDGGARRTSSAPPSMSDVIRAQVKAKRGGTTGVIRI